jgi:uncharacterized protein YacL
LLASGLLEGQVIVAQSVIDELQALADSGNAEKRGRGRRGLKLLSELREQYGRRLVVNSTRYEGNGVDDKLLLLTADTGGTLLTADYNLAKVAEVKALRVLNLSELVIALRPEVQPGDELLLKIARDGKEADQGVGYLDDGTMVVVEGARGRIGERLPVVITGALQNPTGRIVFARCDGARHDGSRSEASAPDAAGPEPALKRKPRSERGKTNPAPTNPGNSGPANSAQTNPETGGPR